MARTIFDCPVFATQGGGLAKKSKDEFIFVEPPEDFPDLKVDDPVPTEWEVVCVTTYQKEANGYVLN